jgi:acyl-CoA reductase-like NAD-dependent aldehyde dehydrogenase
MEARARARRRLHRGVKPSEFTSASTLEFVKLVDEAGFPPGVSTW